MLCSSFSVIPAEEVTDALHALDDDLSDLQANLNDLEQQTIRQLCLHMKIYMVFQCFIMSINFVLLPILFAQAFTYILDKLIEVGPQNPLHAISSVLWFIAVSLGAPLYLGSIWAMYHLPDPASIIDVDLSSLLMLEEFGRLGRLIDSPLYDDQLIENDESEEDYEEPDEAHDFPSSEKDGNEEASEKEDDTRVSQSVTAHAQNESDLPPESSAVSESTTTSNSAITSKVQEDSTDNGDDKKSLKTLFEVDEESELPEMDDMKLLQFCSLLFDGNLHGAKR